MFLISCESAARLNSLILQSCPKDAPMPSVSKAPTVQTAVAQIFKCQSSDSFNLSVLLACKTCPPGFLLFRLGKWVNEVFQRKNSQFSEGAVIQATS